MQQECIYDDDNLMVPFKSSQGRQFVAFKEGLELIIVNEWMIETTNIYIYIFFFNYKNHLIFFYFGLQSLAEAESKIHSFLKPTKI
jgi:hypothetical protein